MKKILILILTIISLTGYSQNKSIQFYNYSSLAPSLPYDGLQVRHDTLFFYSPSGWKTLGIVYQGQCYITINGNIIKLDTASLRIWVKTIKTTKSDTSLYSLLSANSKLIQGKDTTWIKNLTPNITANTPIRIINNIISADTSKNYGRLSTFSDNKLKVDKTTTLTGGVGINSIGDLSTNRTINADTITVLLGKNNAANTYATKTLVATKANKSDTTIYIKSIYQAKQDTIKLNAEITRNFISLTNELSNGAKTGFTITINADPTKINISAGTGQIVNNYIPSNPIYYTINYVGATGIVITNRTTANATYIALDSVSNIIQQTTNFTATQRRRYLILGVVIHSNRSTINAINNQPDIALSIGSQLDDLADALKGFNISGNVFTYNGANLNINKSVGYIFKKGANFVNDNRNPHILNLPVLTAPSNIRYRLQDGTEYYMRSTIMPDSFDNAGVRTIVPANKYTVQRITIFPSNLIRIQYGQTIYNNMADAITAINVDPFVTEQNISDNGLLRCLLVVKRGTTALNNATNAKFLETDRFGGTQAAASNSPLSTLQGDYDNSLKPQIVTTATLGAFQIKRGSTVDADTVFQVLSGSGQAAFSVLGTGALTIKKQSNPTAPTNGTTLFSNTSGRLSWISSINNFTKSFDASSATADRIFRFPDRSITADSITTATQTSGTGYLKAAGNVITFDNSTFNSGTGKSGYGTYWDGISSQKFGSFWRVDTINNKHILIQLDNRATFKPAIELLNTTAADGTNTVQHSPFELFRANGWSSTGSVSLPQYWRFGVTAQTSTTATSFVSFDYGTDNSTFVSKATMSSNGNFTCTATVNAANFSGSGASTFQSTLINNGAVNSNALRSINNTAATTGAKVQNPGNILWNGSVWNASGVAESHFWSISMKGTASTSNSEFAINRYSDGGTTYAPFLRLKNTYGVASGASFYLTDGASNTSPNATITSAGKSISIGANASNSYIVGDNSANMIWGFDSKANIDLGTSTPTTAFQISAIGNIYKVNALADSILPTTGVMKKAIAIATNGSLTSMGNWDASGNTYPTVGSGAGGTVDIGDKWTITVKSTTLTDTLKVNDVIIAKIAIPGQTPSNWNHLSAASVGVTAIARTAGDVGTGYLAYNGTTLKAGQFDGGITAPTDLTKTLNFSGIFRPTKLQIGVYNVTPFTTTDAPLFNMTFSSPTLSLSFLSARKIGAFYTGVTTPYGASRLNYSGLFYTNGLFVNSNASIDSLGAVIIGVDKSVSNASGGLTLNTSYTNLYYGSSNFIMGNNSFVGMNTGGIISKSGVFWLNGGNATTTITKYTAGTTTGITSTDGFNVGVDGTGKPILKNYETNNITINDNTQIEPDGTLVFTGAATTFDDVSCNLLVGGASTPIVSVYNGGTLRAYEYVGNASQTRDQNAMIQLPHSYKEGSDIVVHVHLYVPDDVTGGTVKMSCTYTWTDINSTGAISETTITGTIVRTASQGIANNAILEFPAITGTGKHISSIIAFRLLRDAGDAADTFGSSVWLKSIDAHFEKDGLGSRTISTK
jgi:hypothetical protein